ncbi:hypothetical protein, partial [Nocardioides sp.]|uniref:hypothetical protein n=1 Tax=Nocardioides sp. TaxID=35761 RepID=UPI00321C34F0
PLRGGLRPSLTASLSRSTVRRADGTSKLAPPHARAPHPSLQSQRLIEWARTTWLRPIFVSFLPIR